MPTPDNKPKYFMLDDVIRKTKTVNSPMGLCEFLVPIKDPRLEQAKSHLETIDIINRGLVILPDSVLQNSICEALRLVINIIENKDF